jgi:DNA recombination protein RmuC
MGMVVSLPVLLASSLVAVVVGCLLGWLSQRGNMAAQRESNAELTADNKRLQSEAAAAGVVASANKATADAERDRSKRLECDLEDLKRKHEELLHVHTGLSRQLAEVTTNLGNERQQSAEKLALLDEARGKLSTAFENVANKIMEEKSEKFTKQNKTNLEQVLGPLEAQLSDFKKAVEESQKASLHQSGRLEKQHEDLIRMNSQLSQDASSLARALRASPAAAGRLGDDFLLRVLETVGLQEGVNYRRQQTLKDDAGTSFRPDYILDLPGDRHIVIDAKMSLKDYDGYCNAEDEQSRQDSLAGHLKSVRNHIVQLSIKNYQSLHGLNSLDFVVMFMPIEPAFHLAIAKDLNLWDEALSRNVLLVSPSTLLFVVRTVAHLWKQEQQAQNVRQVMERGGALYDKFVGFVEDIKKIGSSLDQAQSAYGDALGKLSTGPGNLVRQVEMLRVLGVTPRGKKGRLPPDLIAAAMQEGLFALAAEAEEAAEGGDLSPA